MANANIFHQYLQPVRSVADFASEMDAQDLRRQQLVGAERQNALASLVAQQQIQQMSDAAADRNALQRIASGWSAETAPDARIAALRNSGRAALMQQADTLEKQWLDRRKTDSDIGKTGAETDAAKFKLSEEKRKAAVQQVAALGSPQEAIQQLQAKAQAGEVPAPVADALARMIQTDPKWQVKLMLGVGDPQKMAEFLTPLIQTNNTGGATVTQAVDRISGVPTVTGRVQNTQSPDSAASVAATIRGQNMTDARARETNQLTREANATVYDPERGVLINKATALARPAATMDGKPLAAKTPESTKKELASIDAQLSVLDGAIRDVKASPDAFTFKRGLATMAGPLTESAVGRLDSPSERDARSYVFNVVSKVINERAGAAQSAQELARLRSFLPAETDSAQQITDKLESFKGYLSDLGNGYRAGRYQPQQPKATGGNGPARITSDAEYSALPSGATFIGPDGKTRRKP